MLGVQGCDCKDQWSSLLIVSVFSVKKDAISSSKMIAMVGGDSELGKKKLSSKQGMSE